MFLTICETIRASDVSVKHVQRADSYLGGALPRQLHVGSVPVAHTNSGNFKKENSASKAQKILRRDKF